MVYFAENLLLPVVISLITSLVVLHYRSKSVELREINADIRKMIELAMQYPHVEDRQFVDSWKRNEVQSHDELIYDNYGCYVFNLIERIWKHCAGKHDCMYKILHVDEVIVDHQKWWYADRENVNGYDDDFVKYINKVLNRGR
jgi:hypothetical protein